MSIKDTKLSTRRPFANDFIQHHLLNPDHHEAINKDARHLLYALADTGARPAELVGLLPEEIYLNVAIPYITIQSNSVRQLKTFYSEREIPLVGARYGRFRISPMALNVIAI